MKLDIAIVNYNTDFYLRNLLASIAERIPGERINRVHVWDNGSADSSRLVLERFARTVPWLRVHACDVNVHHGRAVDALLRSHCEEDWVLLLDSDTEILRDFLPQLPPLAQSGPAFIGQIHPGIPQLYAYLAHLLINRPLYLALPGFAHDGAPGVHYFREIQEHQIPYCRFRWCDHVRHFGQGALRQVVARGDTANEFYRFAREQTRTAPRSAGRRALEAQLKRTLDEFVSGREGPTTLDGTPGPEAHVSPAISVTARPVPVPPTPAPRSLWSGLFSPRWAFALKKACRLGLVQRQKEIRAVLSLVARRAPRRVLEIGTAHGGSFYLWTRAAASDALLISVDLPPWEPDDPGEARKTHLLRSCGRTAQRVHLIRGDSHSGEVRDRVRSLLGADTIDFLFIDGDHSYEGVKQDWLDYAPLVGSGGLIALHDVHPHSKRWGGEVPEFWREIRARYRTTEIIADAAQDGFGIGVIWR